MTKYETIMNYIENKIADGNIKQGEKLPSIRDISEKFKCSKVTVTKSYELLEKKHIIYSVPKSGHYAIANKLKKSDNVYHKKIDFFTATPNVFIAPYAEFQHCISQAMDLYKDNLFSNSNPQGLQELINVSVKHLQNYQVFTYEKNIFITSGSQQAINILTMMEFPNKKVNVLVEQPTYHGVLKSLELNNINTIGIERKSNGIDFRELENIFKNQNIKFFYIIPRFHNPTGFSYTENDKKKILKLCEKYDVYVVEDDYLGDLEVDKKLFPIYSLDTSERVIYLKTYSKVLLPGLRIAVAVIPSKLINKFEKYKRWTDLNTSILSQGALQIYIKSGMFNKHIKKIKDLYYDRMKYLNNLIINLDSPNIKWYIPRCGFFASLEIDNSVNIKNLIKNLYMKNVLIGDMSRYYLKNDTNTKFIRLSISGVNNDEIERGISIITNEINRFN